MEAKIGSPLPPSSEAVIRSPGAIGMSLLDVRGKSPKLLRAEERKSESVMRLSWALVHSRQPEDVQRGIAMLEASLTNSSSPLQQKEKLYLLAVGYYRCGDYSRSRQLVVQCLEMQPDWKPAGALKKTVEDRIAKDGFIGIGITATALGLIAGGIAAALARKN